MPDIYDYRGAGDPSAVGGFVLQRGQLTKAIGAGEIEFSTGAADGRYTITVVDEDTFTLDDPEGGAAGEITSTGHGLSTGAEVIISGGKWNTVGALIPFQWSVQDKYFHLLASGKQYEAMPFVPAGESLPIGTIVSYFFRFGTAFVLTGECPGD